MEHSRDEDTEVMLGDIIANGSSDDVASFLLDTVDKLDEEEGYVYDGGFDPLIPVQEEDYVHDGSGDTMEVQDEGDRADCSGHRTESGQVYIYIS